MRFEKYMRLALRAATKGTGFVSPNPRVGAVILKDENLVSVGWHQIFGGKHAEIEAIENARGVNLEGSTLIINLEPCSHYGKQPPCVEALINNKFKTVVIGMTDPNPLVMGRGIKRLQEAGIEIVHPVLEEECKWINRFFSKFITTGLPYIILKSGQSINGSIATHSGESKWITSQQSRINSYKLRAEVDAILIGSGTSIADNPQLTVRSNKGIQPYRIVLDTNLKTPVNNVIYIDEYRSKTIIFCSEKSAKSDKAIQLVNLGVNIIECDLDKIGKLEIKTILNELSSRFSISSVLVEGGSKVQNSFVNMDLIDEYHVYIAPKLIPNGINSLNGDFTLTALDQASNMKLHKYNKLGDDMHLIYTRNQL